MRKKERKQKRKEKKVRSVSIYQISSFDKWLSTEPFGYSDQSMGKRLWMWSIHWVCRSLLPLFVCAFVLNKNEENYCRWAGSFCIGNSLLQKHEHILAISKICFLICTWHKINMGEYFIMFSLFFFFHQRFGDERVIFFSSWFNFQTLIKRWLHCYFSHFIDCEFYLVGVKNLP